MGNSRDSLKPLLRLLSLTEEYAVKDGEPGFRAEALKQARLDPRRESRDRAPVLPVALPKEWVRMRSSGPDLGRFEVPPRLEGGPWAEFSWRKGRKLDI